MRRRSATTSATCPPSPRSFLLETPDGRPLHTVRVAAVDAESPRQVAEQADLTVAGATGAVALLQTLAEAARPAAAGATGAQS